MFIVDSLEKKEKISYNPPNLKRSIYSLIYILSVFFLYVYFT